MPNKMKRLSRTWLVAAFTYVGLVILLLGLGKSIGGDLGGSEGWIVAYIGLWCLAYPAGYVILLVPFSDAMGPVWNGALLGAIGFSQWFVLWPVLCRVLARKSHSVTAFLTISIFIMSAYYGMHGISSRETLHSDGAYLAMIGAARNFSGQRIGRNSMKERPNVHKTQTRFWSCGRSPKGD